MNEIVYTTNSYKYLGFVITPSGEITQWIERPKGQSTASLLYTKK